MARWWAAATAVNGRAASAPKTLRRVLVVSLGVHGARLPRAHPAEGARAVAQRHLGAARVDVGTALPSTSSSQNDHARRPLGRSRAGQRAVAGGRGRPTDHSTSRPQNSALQTAARTPLGSPRRRRALARGAARRCRRSRYVLRLAEHLWLHGGRRSPTSPPARRSSTRTPRPQSRRAGGARVRGEHLAIGRAGARLLELGTHLGGVVSFGGGRTIPERRARGVASSKRACVGGAPSARPRLARSSRSALASLRRRAVGKRRLVARASMMMRRALGSGLAAFVVGDVSAGRRRARSAGRRNGGAIFRSSRDALERSASRESRDRSRSARFVRRPRAATWWSPSANFARPALAASSRRLRAARFSLSMMGTLAHRGRTFERGPFSDTDTPARRG